MRTYRFYFGAHTHTHKPVRSCWTSIASPESRCQLITSLISRHKPSVLKDFEVQANGEFGTPPRGRSPNANALVAPDGLLRQLLRQLLRTPTPRCSGPREPGGAAASTARRGRFERPRRALAPARLPRPPSSEGRVGELHAHRDGVRATASRSSPRSRACPPPNAQESERAKACKARRAQ